MCISYSTAETLAGGWLNPVIEEFFNFFQKSKMKSSICSLTTCTWSTKPSILRFLALNMSMKHWRNIVFYYLEVFLNGHDLMPVHILQGGWLWWLDTCSVLMLCIYKTWQHFLNSIRLHSCTLTSATISMVFPIKTLFSTRFGSISLQISSN